MRDIDADCETECRDLESASSLGLNSQNCDECIDITDLNVGLQPEEDKRSICVVMTRIIIKLSNPPLTPKRTKLKT